MSTVRNGRFVAARSAVKIVVSYLLVERRLRRLRTSRRKAKSPGTQFNPNRPKSGSFKPAIQSGRIDEDHRIAQVDDAHECRRKAVHTRKNPSASEDSMSFGEYLILQYECRYVVKHGEGDNCGKRTITVRHCGGVSMLHMDIRIEQAMPKRTCKRGIELKALHILYSISQPVSGQAWSWANLQH